MSLFDATFADLPAQSFDFIMSDPPWRLIDFSEKGDKTKTAAAQYRLMSIEEIKALPVLDLAAPNCLLWLWTTNPMLPQALEVVKAWGFRYSTMGDWVKLTKNGKLAFGTGHRLRNCNEPFIIATRGQPRTTRVVRSVIMGQVRAHSQKPEEAYREAERLMPGPHVRRLDMFSRTDRPLWTAWGDQRNTIPLEEAA